MSDETETRIANMRGMATLVFQKGKHDEAIKLAAQVCYFAREWLGEEHPEYATSLNELARMFVMMENYAEAEPIMLKALDIYAHSLGVNHPDYATGLFNLAVLYHNADNLTAAESYYLQALDVQRRELGAHHPNVGVTLGNLALLYEKQENFTALEPLYLELLEIRRAVLDKYHPDVVKSLHIVVQTYQRMGRDADAVPFQREAVELYRHVSGESSLDYAISLNNLAELYRVTGQYAAAEPLYRETLAIHQIEDTEQRPLHGTVLNNLGLLYRDMGNYAAAEPLFQQALHILRDVHGANHPAVATSLNTLGALYSAQGHYVAAEKLLREALEIRRSALGAQHPDVATSLNNLALLNEEMGNYRAAEPLFREASEIWRTAFGEHHPTYANSLNNLANLLHRTSRYEEAVTLHRQALEIRRAALGEQHPLVASSMDNLGTLYRAMGNYVEAERMEQQAVAAYRASLGERHPEYAISLGNLAFLYQEMANYAAAEPLYQQALDIQRAALGERHPSYATTLNNLALLYQLMHNNAAAQSTHMQVLRIRQAVLGEQHPDVAQSLNNLGTVLWETGRLDEALTFYLQALDIRRAALGQQHADVAQTLNNLATLYLTMKQYDEAVKMVQEAILIWQTTLGAEHPFLAQSLNNLATIYNAMGRFGEAESVNHQALEMRRKVLGAHHPDVAQSLSNLAWDYAVTKREADALTLLCEAATIDDRMLGQVFSIGSESQRMAYLETTRLALHFLLSLVFRIGADVPEAARSAFDLVLRRKAIGVEVLAVQRDAILAGRYPALEQSLGELTALRVRIARTWLSGPGTDDPAERQQRLAEWEAERDRRERDLARHIPELNFEQRFRSVEWQAVARALPAETCLVEFIRYYGFDFDAREVKHARYAAFVLAANAPDAVQLIDLGTTEPIERLIGSWRRAITGRAQGPAVDGNWTQPAATNNVREIVRQATRHLGDTQPAAPGLGRDEGDQLRVLLFDALVPALHGCRRLLIAPDGDLALLPFEALPLGDDRYLLDEYTISYLGVGRDLLHLASTTAAAAHAPLVISDPDYDLGAETVPAFARNTPFQRLEDGLAEGRAVADLLHTTPLAQGEALESRLRAHRSPSILHIATHGFFEPYSVERPAANDLGGLIAARSERRLEQVGLLLNPMLRSGLALAGANTWAQDGSLPAEAEDGILTAEDVTGLDLLDTELVVLSACETGLGEVHVGEGVFGLRRAFTVAGTKTLVMSLWKVPDRQTRDLMTLFYEDLLQGKPRIEALREAQLQMRTRHPQPFYWGAFICQGEAGPLRASV
jgi:tetratricopeptide (TPR) repeat protein/CHAT domain-containing protein